MLRRILLPLAKTLPYFITMEDERGKPRYWYFKRNYRNVFEAYGYKQLEEEPIGDIMGKEFTYRLFIRI